VNGKGRFMKTFSTTDARNRFGEFLDAGMVERVKLVRNNRVVGYFLPEREYNELTSSVSARDKSAQRQDRLLTSALEETLNLYSQGKIGASEAKADLACDTRGLLALLNQRGLPLPHVSLEMAEKMAHKALVLMNIPISDQTQPKRNIHRG
jgi:hypothetical protein